MTPTNPLDKKVIVDRETLENLILYWVNSDVDSKVLSAAKQALAQDLTGWAAVPVKPSRAMIQAGMDGYNSKVFGSDGIAAAYPAMLNASPALFETKEKQNEQA